MSIADEKPIAEEKSVADNYTNPSWIEMYLMYWQEMKEQARHFDGVRTQTSAIIMAAVGLTAAFVAENGLNETTDVVASLAIILSGILGFVMNEVYTVRVVERNSLNNEWPKVTMERKIDDEFACRAKK